VRTELGQELLQDARRYAVSAWGFLRRHSPDRPLHLLFRDCREIERLGVGVIFNIRQVDFWWRREESGFKHISLGMVVVLQFIVGFTQGRCEGLFRSSIACPSSEVSDPVLVAGRFLDPCAVGVP
jgi:hypothetical protein